MAALHTSALSRMVILHLSVALQAMMVHLIEMTDIAIHSMKFSKLALREIFKCTSITD